MKEIEMAGLRLLVPEGVGIWDRIARSQAARAEGDLGTALDELTLALVQVLEALHLRESVG